MLLKSTCYSAALATWLLLPAVAMPVGAMAQTQTPAAGAATTPQAKTATKPQSRVDRVEQHINQLHTQLRITPAQQGAWDQFAQVMRDNAKNMSETLTQRGTQLRIDECGRKHAVLCPDCRGACPGYPETGRSVPDTVWIDVGRPEKER